jgi:hypothetical protein
VDFSSQTKPRWISFSVQGFTQQEGVDYGENFSPVVKPATICVVLSIATSSLWPIHQVDVKNAFLHGELAETVYCIQPTGFVDSDHPTNVYKAKEITLRSETCTSHLVSSICCLSSQSWVHLLEE